jgi:hypothetical protein
MSDPELSWRYLVPQVAIIVDRHYSEDAARMSVGMNGEMSA